MQYGKKYLYTLIQEQLSMEFNCKPEDFQRADIENVLVLPTSHKNRRYFTESDTPFFFRMASMGNNAVISADRPLHPWLREFIRNRVGHHLFEHPYLMELETQLKRYGETLGQSHHMFLPHAETQVPELTVPVKWLEQEAIPPFYVERLFPNALGEAYYPKRPDVLAVCAYDGDTIMGMAGCSADTPLMWQVGVDVMTGYRGCGIGSYLISLLKIEIMRQGKIPYYGTSLSNLHSQNIAVNCGFYPAWIEIETIHT